MAENFADALNELMAGSGTSNNRLAGRVDVDPAQVGRWRKGVGLPRPENIVRIASVFGVNYEWLMGIAYPESRPRADGELDPELAAFLAEIQTRWRAMDKPTREIVKHTALALFSVPPVRVRGHDGMRVSARSRAAREMQEAHPDVAEESHNDPIERPYRAIGSALTHLLHSTTPQHRIAASVG